MSQEPTNKEIMGAIGELHEAVSAFASNVDERFERLESRMGSMESKMGSMESRVDSIESKMVTKDYLDEKLFDLRGDMTTIVKKEDRKVASLVEVLFNKKILTKKDKENILEMEPFPKSI